MTAATTDRKKVLGRIRRLQAVTVERGATEAEALTAAAKLGEQPSSNQRRRTT